MLLRRGRRARLDELDADEAAAELAERLAEYRRVKAGAAWLEERLAAEADRFFRIGPAPLAPVARRPLATQDPAKLESAMRALAAEPPAPSLAHLALRFPPMSLFLERFRAVLAQAHALRLRRGGGRSSPGSSRRSRSSPCSSCARPARSGSARTSPSRRSPFPRSRRHGGWLPQARWLIGKCGGVGDIRDRA